MRMMAVEERRRKKRRRVCKITAAAIVSGFLFGAGAALAVFLVHSGSLQQGAITPSTSSLQPPISSPTTLFPAISPSLAPPAPEASPRTVPTSLPTINTTTTFYAIGDVPYDSSQAERIKIHLHNLPADAEFVIHVGDLRNSDGNRTCLLSQYEAAATLFRESHAPVFVILGDNDWTDCPNRDEGLQLWKDTFLNFESRHWNHTFNIQHQQGRPDNFAFVHKNSLFIGLNIVGGDIHSNSEWTTRLTEQFEWTKELIEGNRNSISSVVIFGHANPNHRHNTFFRPLQAYIQDVLQNEIPMLYVNGDKHEWSYDPNFYEQPSLLRIMVSGGATDLPLQVHVIANEEYVDPVDSFPIDRRLES